jgi:ribosomal protein S18 acetylase RimI-like enzyme
MDGMRIRRAKNEDAAALGRLGAMLLETHYAFDSNRFMRPLEDSAAGYAWFLRSQLNDEDVVVFVAEHDQEIVGYVYAGLEPQSWKELREAAGFIHDVVVDPSSQRKGVAELLISASTDWLKERGAPRVMLWTADQNIPAQRLFTKIGFRRTMVEMTLELKNE